MRRRDRTGTAGFPRFARARLDRGFLPLILLLVAGPAFGQQQPAPTDKPRDDEIFGPTKKDEPPKKDEPTPTPTPPPSEGDPAAPKGPASQGGAEGQGARVPPAAEPPRAGAGTDQSRDDAVMGDASAPTRFSDSAAPDNPLTIGGQFYLRAAAAALEEQNPRDWSLATPSLLDAYFDARPNPRVRGFVLARMQFDPTRPATASMTGLDPGGGVPQLSLLAAPTRGPVVGLDQMWLRFDIKRTVFITAGKQHVRWGTARFWTPTDFLHVQRRNPLDPFDARAGTTMLKVHLPWEERGWNLYAYGITELADGSPTVADVAGAGRAEVVFGTAELGLGAMVERGRKPKLGADLSFGVWDLDLYGEIALRYASEIDRVGFDEGADVLTMFQQRWPIFRESGLRPQVVGGFTYSRQYADKDIWTLGGEYFYNSLGYDDPNVYPGLFPVPGVRALSEPPSFFYFGRQYAALFLALPSPGSWDLTSFSLSTLGNFSDRSFISRLDYSLTLLTHLRFEAFVAVHYGRSKGEFRFALDPIPPVFAGKAANLVDLGVALRVSL